MFGLSSKYTVSDAYLLHSHKIPRRGMGIILRKHFLQVNRSPCSCPWLLLQFKYSEIRRIVLSHFFNYLHSPPSKMLQAQALQPRSLRASHSFVIMVLFLMGDNPSGAKRDPNSYLSNSRWVLFSLPFEMQNPSFLLLLILPSGTPSAELRVLIVLPLPQLKVLSEGKKWFFFFAITPLLLYKVRKQKELNTRA